MKERPVKGKAFEDLGSDFAPQRGAGGKRPGGSQSAARGAFQKASARKPATIDVDDDSDESDDELDCLSQSSRQVTRRGDRKRGLDRTPSIQFLDGVEIDGVFHEFHKDYAPQTQKLPSFKKNKKSTEGVVEVAAPSSSKPYPPLPSSTKASKAAATSTPKPSSTSSTRKTLGARRPPHPQTRTKPASQSPEPSDDEVEETPRPKKRPVKTRLAPRKQENPIWNISPVRSPHSDDGDDNKRKGKQRACPIEQISPLKERSNELRKKKPPFLNMSPLSSQTGKRVADRFPMLSPLRSPSLSSSQNAEESSAQASLKSSGRKSTGKNRVVISSESSESTEDEDRPRKARPFPMQSQMLQSIRRSPGKRASDGSDKNRERKRIKGADEMLAEIMHSDGMSEVNDEDLLFLDPNVDPSTLCPWCDESLPPVPSPHLANLIEAARARSYSDSRPTNPLGLRATPMVFVGVCQRHRFESIQIPLAQQKGWPTKIAWEKLGKRIKSIKSRLQAIVDDVDEQFLPGHERQDVDDDEDETAAVDDKQLLKTRPRMGSAFWREVVKNVKKKGSRKATGIHGQMSNFSKIQPGYYGELGSVIISQTIYNLFPPSEFPPHSTLPLTPTEFIQRILVPEAAVSLVIQDMQQTRAQAIATLRESAQYGVAMFPDDHTEGTSGSTNAGEQIVRERAAVRRRELEKEEREEEEIWGMFSEPMSEVDGQQSKKGRSRASSTAVNEKRESSRPPRRKASSHVGLRDTDSDSDVVMNSNDADYAPAKFRKLPAVKSSKPSTATKKEASYSRPRKDNGWTSNLRETFSEDDELSEEY
ncbi:hypothetical protein EW026_g1928 [Hermanssonia centrifuga]|uniref:Restriction of telomere capping protein 4 n=1 Tax=Hermanssonia centrifuga TaxID=98765 RepID=A0A4V3XB71_9APHY|nr:hypothetical protein EW026_g1928 [Hermanssonia centrifuga]